MPSLRILVVGGDGTVSWIITCLDTLRQELEAAAAAAIAAAAAAGAGVPGVEVASWRWSVPPVGICPLGTGESCGGWRWVR